MRPLFYLKHALHLLLRPWILLRGPLRESDFAAEPIEQFKRWYRWIKLCIWLEFPEAMSIGTVSKDGRSQSRFALLKGVDERGFVFFTNYNSAKGRAIAANPNVSLAMYWDALGWQVRVEGEAEKISAAESDRYFATRPRASQIGAWASNQSEVVPDRAELELRYAETEKRFSGADVPRPEQWGGYRVVPQSVEFWQLGAGRMHDRLRYRKTESGWALERLSP